MYACQRCVCEQIKQIRKHSVIGWGNLSNRKTPEKTKFIIISRNIQTLKLKTNTYIVYVVYINMTLGRWVKDDQGEKHLQQLLDGK